MSSIEKAEWIRWGPPVEAGLEFMLQGYEWMYNPKKIKKVVDWCRENLTEPHFFWMASDDVAIYFEDNYNYVGQGDGRLCVRTLTEVDALAFKLRWL